MSISGEGTNAGASGMLGAALARGIIYPVPAVFNVRKNSLTVAPARSGAGAWAPMARCIAEDLHHFPSDAREELDHAVLRAEFHRCAPYAQFGYRRPLRRRPGAAQAESKFDFQREQVPPEKVGKLIILKGVLRTDGFIDELQVYQSVLSEMDDNARLAFSQWKFKPALRESKPVAVQVLVGIPTALPNPSSQ